MFICNIRSLATNGRLRYDVVRNANLRFNITAAPTVATNITIVRGHNIRRIRTRAPARVQLTLLTFVLSIHFCRVPLHAYTIQPTRWIYCLLHIIAMCDVLYLRFLEYVMRKKQTEKSSPKLQHAECRTFWATTFQIGRLQFLYFFISSPLKYGDASSNS